jgi:hypothetical protein
MSQVKMMAAVGLLGLLGTACHHIKPIAPVIPPAPQPAPQIENSIVVVPVSYDFSSAIADLNAKVPNHLGNINSDWIEDPPGNRYKYKFEIWRRPFSLSVNGTSIAAASVIEYAAAGGYDPPIAPIITGSCGVGEPHREVAVAIGTTVSLAPTWNLTANTSITRLDALNRCQLTFLNFDVTDKILDRARGILSQNLGRLDDSIKNINVKTPVERGWDRLSSPVELAPKTWLQLNLNSVYFGGIRGSGTTLQTTVGVSGTPRITYGDRPSNNTAPLPSLSAAPATQGFHVALEGIVTHATASSDLAARLRGKRFYQGRQYIEVTDASVYSVGSNTAVVEIQFVGSAKGRIFFTGRPVYDNVSGMLSIPDLDYDVNTKNILLKVANWLIHDDARNFFRQYAQWNAAPAVNLARSELQSALNKDLGGGFTLNGNVSAITPLGIWVSTSEFTVGVRADGAVTLNGIAP